jgi:hypothetical protein
VTARDDATSDPLGFALAHATEDVASAFRWLLDDGFDVVRESGPPYSSFGFYVDVEGAGLHARLLLDRSQG